MNNSLKQFLRITLLFASAVTAQSQGAAFSYQGRLSNAGNPANGKYYMSFALFNAAQAGNQIADQIVQGPISVSNGLFNVVLSFSGSATFDGAPRWLEIRVIEENEPAPATLLTPRQQILASPYATTAANLSGVLPESKLPSNVARLNANQVLDVAGAVAVNGTTIIDAAGNWIGNTAGLSLNTLRSGPGAPQDNLGATGDFYFDTSVNVIYGPKSGQGGNRWGNGTIIVGPTGPEGIQGLQGLRGFTGEQGPPGPQGPANGTAVLNGVGVPTSSTGTNGDFYIDTSAHSVYGPKTSGGWGEGTSLIGPQGPRGIQGIQGQTGATGPPGVQGIQGAQGPAGPPGINTFAACGYGVLSLTCNTVCNGAANVAGQQYNRNTGASCTASAQIGSCQRDYPGGNLIGYCCVCRP